MVVAAAEVGFKFIEITLDSPDALKMIGDVVRECPGLVVGAGTVHTRDEVKRIADVGGQFIVAPVISESVLRTAHELGLATFPGAATPTEIQTAIDLGATAVKVFPAQQLGGPGYLEAIRAPLRKPKLIPTGGVDSSNARQYLNAGAIAVGVGGSMFPKLALDNGDVGAVKKAATEFLKAIQ
jgi:2-dehydro-3-deoxyphosphogluconate aldolase / (4S)-4-hydroxy-2-oxoglutarate aldolase